jgi:hypothetical protein
MTLKADVVIQVTDDRRIISYPYGWRLEKLHIPEEPTKNDPNCEGVWLEDRPAYPANLSHAFSMLLERLFAEKGDLGIGEVPKRLTEALRALEEVDLSARKLAKGESS